MKSHQVVAIGDWLSWLQVRPANKQRLAVFANRLLYLGKEINEAVDYLEELASKTHPYGCRDLIVSTLGQLKVPAS
jgi:hypothetical protein